MPGLVVRQGLTQVQPRNVLACRSVGLAGRDSLQSAGCWIFQDVGQTFLRDGADFARWVPSGVDIGIAAEQ